MSFDPNECAIPTTYCGDGPVPRFVRGDDVYYTGRGSRAECLRKGIGVGAAKEREKDLPGNSLQRIKYIGPKYEENLVSEGIRNTSQLMNEIRRDVDGTFDKIKRALSKGGNIDYRAYNSVLMYVYRAGGTNLPPCKKLY